MRQKTRKHFYHLLLLCAGLLAALLAPLLLRAAGIAGQIDGQVVALGFDAERVLVIDALALAFLSGLLSGLLFQKRSAAWLGSLLWFVTGYLLSFAQQALRPGLSPTGQAQTVIPAAFAGVVATLFASAVLFSGAGAVLGQAVGDVLIAPFAVLGRAIFAPRFAKKSSPAPARKPLLSLITGGLVVCMTIVSMNGISPILTYGPSTNLYQAVPGRVKQTPARPKAASGPGTLAYGTFASPALGGIQRGYWIYLPPSYAMDTARRYPVVYLLHGSPGGAKDWFAAAHANTTADTLIAAGKMREVILVGADGNGPVYRFSEWANSFDGRQHMEDALALDLVRFIDIRYRTLASADNRIIAGLSMGGYGAANIALHHPGIFHYSLCFSGYYQAEGPVFGAGPGSTAYRQFNSPALFLHTSAGRKAAAQVTFVIGIGTNDGSYKLDGQAFYQELAGMKARASLLADVGGHSWRMWAKQLAQALPLILSAPVSGTLH